MSLDDKLREILHQAGYGSEMIYETDDALVAQIKQAFADGGYVQVPKEVQETWREYNRMAGYMTGQEWYDRFQIELARDQTKWEINHLSEVPKFLGKRTVYVLEAAKKAAGLE